MYNAAPDVKIKDGLNKHKYIPNLMHFESKLNSLAYFDNQEFEIAKTKGTKRVIAIADSLGCTTVPIKYHMFTKAENLEGNLGNPKWEIYNFSLSGINIEKHLYLLKQEALTYNPDLVLIGFYVGNDWWIDEKFKNHNIEKSAQEILSEKIIIFRTIKRLNRIYKSGYLKEQTKFVDDKDIEGIVDWQTQRAVVIHSEEWWKDINNGVQSTSMPSDMYLPWMSSEIEINSYPMDHPIYSRLEDIFKEMKQLTNNRLAVVLFPQAVQVDKDLRETLLKYLFSKKENEKYPENIDMDHFYNNMKDMLERLEIPVIEILDQLKKGHEKYGRVYPLQNIHFNYWGNDIATQEIRNFLKDYFEENE